jgi:hypothetical protein
LRRKQLVRHKDSIDDVNDVVRLKDTAVVSVAMTLFASVSMIGDGQSRRKVFFVAVILIVFIVCF